MKTIFLTFALIISAYGYIYGQTNDSISILRERCNVLESQLNTLQKQFDNYCADKLKCDNEDKSQIYHLMADYLNSRSCEERLKYVVSGNNILQAMNEFYSDGLGVYGTTDFEKRDFLIGQPDVQANLRAIPVYVVGTNKTCYVVKTKDGYRVDWKGTVLYNATSVKDIYKKKIGTPTLVRISIRDAYEDSEDGLCHSFEISDWKYTMPARMDKSNPYYAKIKSLCDDGKAHNATVFLVYDAQGWGDVKITKLIVTSTSSY